MDHLINGVRQFMDSVYEEEEELFKGLAHGQSPKTLFIACSDSRVAPRLITQAKPGDLFSIRNAGNFIPADHVGGESATIEYAISVLGVRDIVICGHSDCGAVKALINPPPLGQMPFIDAWLSHGRKVIEILEKHEEWRGKSKLDHAIELNVLLQLTNLSRHPAVVAAIAKGEVSLHGWVYDIGAGEIRAFNNKEGAFLPLTEASAGIPPEQLESLVSTH